MKAASFLRACNSLGRIFFPGEEGRRQEKSPLKPKEWKSSYSCDHPNTKLDSYKSLFVSYTREFVSGCQCLKENCPQRWLFLGKEHFFLHFYFEKEEKACPPEQNKNKDKNNFQREIDCLRLFLIFLLDSVWKMGRFRRNKKEVGGNKGERWKSQKQ